MEYYCIGSAVQVTRSKVGKARMQECLREVQGLPLLIVTGAKDRYSNDSTACVISTLQSLESLLLWGIDTSCTLTLYHLAGSQRHSKWQPSAISCRRAHA